MMLQIMMGVILKAGWFKAILVGACKLLVSFCATKWLNAGIDKIFAFLLDTGFGAII